jgi:hypothetical protein
MSAMRFALALVLILSASISMADAEKRYSGWEPNTSMRFGRTLEPSIYVGAPEVCRELCLKDERCQGWTYYHPEYTGDAPREVWEPLRGTCVMGTGTTIRNRQKAPGLTSGMITTPFPCTPNPEVEDGSYMC